MLFNMGVDILAIIIQREKIDGYIEEVVPHLVDSGLSLLNTILFLKHDLKN
jgi:hypothetical protein